ncbi:MAG: IS200/IS605 family transposase [Bacteroidales bacterium]|nr:IS200/IS605 family transposase [Bacteroidales bacterium]
MANTYTQLYVHYDFAVQDRLCLINHKWQDNLYRNMSGIIDQQGHKLYVINRMNDHIHILISMTPKQAPSDLMYHLKRSSSLWINHNRLSFGKFSWQEVFGAFSVGKSQLSEKIKYIEEQQQHHKKASFRGEYLHFLKEYDIEYDERYIFTPIE